MAIWCFSLCSKWCCSFYSQWCDVCQIIAKPTSYPKDTSLAKHHHLPLGKHHWKKRTEYSVRFFLAGLEGQRIAKQSALLRRPNPQGIRYPACNCPLKICHRHILLTRTAFSRFESFFSMQNKKRTHKVFSFCFGWARRTRTSEMPESESGALPTWR